MYSGPDNSPGLRRKWRRPRNRTGRAIIRRHQAAVAVKCAGISLPAGVTDQATFRARLGGVLERAMSVSSICVVLGSPSFETIVITFCSPSL